MCAGVLCAPRRTGVVRRQIEVVRCSAIDRAVPAASVEILDRHRYSAAGEIAEHEAEGHPLPQLGGGNRRIEAGQQHPVIHSDAAHRRERDESGAAAGVRCHRQPVRADLHDAAGQQLPGGEFEGDRGLGGRECAQTRAYLDAGDPEPLRLGIQGRTLCFPLRSELTLEVLEQPVPVHGIERRGPRVLGVRVIHNGQERSAQARSDVFYFRHLTHENGTT